MHPECEVIQNDFECEPAEQLGIEVDDIVIHDNDENDMKSNDNDLCPIANDPYKSAAETKHFDKGIYLDCNTLCKMEKTTTTSKLKFLFEQKKKWEIF